MTAEPSPRPWRVEESIGGWKSCVADANGNSVASCWGRGPTEQQEKAEAIAALIVDAVNERDRLRDIVRQALPFIEGAIDTVSTILGDAEMSKAAGECGAPPKDVQEAFVADGRRVLREARAAIGEETR